MRKDVNIKRGYKIIRYIATNMKIILDEECFSLWFKCSNTTNIKLYAPAMLIKDPDLGFQAILFPRFILIITGKSITYFFRLVLNF